MYIIDPNFKIKIIERERREKFPSTITTILENLQQAVKLSDLEDLYSSEFMVSYLVSPRSYTGEKLIFFVSHLFLFDYLKNKHKSEKDIKNVASELLYVNSFKEISTYEKENEHIKIILNYIEEKINDLIEYSIDITKPWDVTLKRYTPEYIMKSICNRIEYEKKLKETEGVMYVSE